MKGIDQIGKTARRYWLLPAVCGLIAFALSCSGDVSKKQTKSPVEEGSEWFASYCAICHGANGDGTGNMVDKLDGPPPDLRTIAQRRNGTFPDEEIATFIAGMDKVPGHSTSDMPAWWEAFKKAENITDDKVMEEKIGHIVAYLKTIQQ